MKVHHIGYLIEEIKESISGFIELGYVIEKDIIFDNYRNIYIAFLSNNGYCVELIQPTDEAPGLKKMLRKTGNTPYHICYETTDIQQSISNLQQKGYIVMQQQAIAPAIENMKVAFLMNANIGIIELLEIKEG